MYTYFHCLIGEKNLYTVYTHRLHLKLRMRQNEKQENRIWLSTTSKPL